MIKVFGLKTCDKTRNAIKWLKANGVEFEFLDIREKKPSINLLEHWVGEVGWELLLNRRSITWRKLPKDETKNLDSSRALALIFANPTLIKRPIFEVGEGVHVGFKAEEMVDFKR